MNGPFYLCFNNNPLAYGAWERDEVTVVDTFDTREAAEAARSDRNRMYRMCCGGHGYYFVSTELPINDDRPLAPFDPADAGESMDPEEGVYDEDSNYGGW